MKIVQYFLEVRKSIHFNLRSNDSFGNQIKGRPCVFNGSAVAAVDVDMLEDRRV